MHGRVFGGMCACNKRIPIHAYTLAHMHSSVFACLPACNHVQPLCPFEPCPGCGRVGPRATSPERLELGILGGAQWYRARVEKVVSSDPINPTYDLLFVDFGNRERVPGNRVRGLEPALAAVAPQAHQASLAYLKIPPVSDEIGEDAAARLSELTGT